MFSCVYAITRGNMKQKTHKHVVFSALIADTIERRKPASIPFRYCHSRHRHAGNINETQGDSLWWMTTWDVLLSPRASDRDTDSPENVLEERLSFCKSRFSHSGHCWMADTFLLVPNSNKPTIKYKLSMHTSLRIIANI